MHELLHRFAVAVLLLSGALTAGMPPDVWLAPSAPAASLLAHRQLLLFLLGAGLVVAAFVPAWRLPVVVAAIMSKAALLVLWRALPDGGPASLGVAALEGMSLALLLAAAAVLVREAWQEARWHASPAQRKPPRSLRSLPPEGASVSYGRPGGH